MEIKLDLFGAHMTPTHRAGLGGLACFARWFARTRRESPGEVNLPGEIEVQPERVTLRFDDPAKFLAALYAAAFQIREDVIYLPSILADATPWRARHLLQNAIFGTVLQSNDGKKFDQDDGTSPPPATKGTSKKPAAKAGKLLKVKVFHDDEGNEVQVRHPVLNWYPQQVAYKNFFRKGRKGEPELVFEPNQPVPILNYIAPSFVERHPGKGTHIHQTFVGALPLHFVLLGAIPFPMGRNTALFDPSNSAFPRKDRYGYAIVIPDVIDLVAFAQARPTLSPTLDRQYEVKGLGDAALRCNRHLHSSVAGLGIYYMDLTGKQSQRLRAIDINYDNLKPEEVIAAERIWDRYPSHGQFSYVGAQILDNFARGIPWWTDFDKVVPDKKTLEAIRNSRSDSKNPLYLSLKECLRQMIELADQESPDLLLYHAIQGVLSVHYRSFCENLGITPSRTPSPDKKSRLYTSMKNKIQDFWLAIRNAGTHSNLVFAVQSILSSAPGERNYQLGDRYLELHRWLVNPANTLSIRGISMVAVTNYGGSRSRAESPEPETVEEPDSSAA
jgi:hypothetical protein